MNDIERLEEKCLHSINVHQTMCFCGQRKRAVLVNKGNDVWDIAYMCEKEWTLSYHPMMGLDWPHGLRWPEAAPIVEEWL